MVEPAAGKVKVGHTSKFSVLDAKGSKVKHVAIKAAAATAADVGDEGALHVACYCYAYSLCLCLMFPTCMYTRDTCAAVCDPIRDLAETHQTNIRG